LRSTCDIYTIFGSKGPYDKYGNVIK